MGKGEDLGGALVGDHASASVFKDSGRGDNIKYSVTQCSFSPDQW